MLWGDTLSIETIFHGRKSEEVLKWLSERKEKVAVGILVGYLLYRKTSYFLVTSPKPDGKPIYQEILPINLTVKGLPLVFGNWLVTSRGRHRGGFI